MKKSLLVLNLFFLISGRVYASEGMDDLFASIKNMSELSKSGALYKSASSAAVPENVGNQKKEEISGEHKSKSSTGANFGKLKSNMRSNNKEPEFLQRQVEQNKIEYLKIKGQKEVVQAQLTKTQLQLAAAEKDKLEIHNEFKQLLEQNKKLEEELRKAGELQATIEDQQGKITKNEQEKQQLKEQMASLKQTLESIQSQKSEGESQIAKLTRSFSEAKKVAEESRNKASQLLLELERLRKEKEEKSSEVQELTQKIQGLEKAQEEYEALVKNFRTKEADFSTAEQKHVDELKASQQKYNDSASNLLQIKQQLADKEDVIKQLQNSLEVAEPSQSTSGADDLLKRIVELEVELNTKNELVDEYQMRNEQMKRDLESRKTENEASPADQETLVTTKFDDDASLVSLDQVSNGGEEGALNLVEYLLGQLNKAEKDEITFNLDQLRDLVSKISEFESNLIEENNELREEVARLADEVDAQEMFVDQNWWSSLNRDLYKTTEYFGSLVDEVAEVRDELHRAMETASEDIKEAVSELLARLIPGDGKTYGYLVWLKDQFAGNQETTEDVYDENLQDEVTLKGEDSHEFRVEASSHTDQRSAVSDPDMTKEEKLGYESEGSDDHDGPEQSQGNQRSDVEDHNAQTMDGESACYEEDREEAQDLVIKRTDYYDRLDNFFIAFDYINLLRNNRAILKEALSLVRDPQRDSNKTSLAESDKQEEQQQEEFFEHLRGVVESLEKIKKNEFLDREGTRIQAVTGQNEYEEEAEMPEDLNKSQMTENDQGAEYIEEEEEDQSDSPNITESQNDDSSQLKNSDTEGTQNEATESSISQVNELTGAQNSAHAEETSSKSADIANPDVESVDLLNAIKVLTDSKEADKSRLLDALSVNNKLAYATLYCLYCYQSTLFNRQAGNQCALTPEEEGAAKEFCKRALSRNEDFPNSDGSMYGLLSNYLKIYNSGVMDAVLAINGDQDKRDAVWNIVNKYLSK